jgi:ribose transport system substrate-binding protein
MSSRTARPATRARSRAKLTAAAAAALGLMLLAGCSRASSSTDAASGPASGAAKQLHAQAATESPTTFQGPTAPVKPPAGVKVAVVTCYSILHGCVSPADGIQKAAAALGWHVTVLDGGGTPTQQNAQMLNAVSSGAKVIINIAIDPNSVQSGLQAAKRAGVLVGAGSNGLDTPNPVAPTASGKLGYAFDVAPNYGALGKKAAQWIQADSAGKGDVAVYSDKEFPSVLALQAGLLRGLKACRGCKAEPLQYFTGTEVPQVLPQSVVSFIRSNPQVKYVFIPYDPAAATVVPAIAQAGLISKVKVISVLGDQQNLGFIRGGRVQIADAAYDNLYMGYAIIDQVARSLDHEPLAKPAGENLPFLMLDHTNLPAPGADWHASFAYIPDFTRLWKG